MRNYTQNIDTLESLAGVTNVLQCHGSFSTASCLRCKDRMPGSVIEPYIMSQRIPYCPKCRPQRDAEIAAIKAYRAQRRAKSKSKGKAKATWDDDETEDDDDDIPEWSGEPGIIKVGRSFVPYCGALWLTQQTHSRTLHSLARRSTLNLTNACSGIASRSTCSSSWARVSRSRP